MGKKRSNGGEAEAVLARQFVLKVAMHCRCHGCRDKVRAAVRGLTLAPGVEAADGSAAESSGEVRLLATSDPERLRRRLRRATGKKVDLLLLLPPPCKEQGKNKMADAGALQALLADLQLQQALLPAARQQYGGGNGAAPAVWAAKQQQQQQLMGLGLGNGGWNGGGGGSYGAVYPWATSSSSYYPATHATGWGAYSHPPTVPAPAHGLGGYYGGRGGAPAWHGY